MRPMRTFSALHESPCSVRVSSSRATRPARLLRLVISVRTVDDHISAIYNKLELPKEDRDTYHPRVLAVLRYLESDD